MSPLISRLSVSALVASLLFAAAPVAFATDSATVAGSARGAPLQTFTVAGTGVGMIPDGPGTPTSCGSAGTPLDIGFTLPALAGELVDLDVELHFSPVHIWGSDVTAVLISPGGLRQHTLFGRLGAITAAACGHGADLAGPYIFSDAATPPSGGLWQAAQAAGGASQIPAGSYFTTDSGGEGAVNPMPPTSLVARFAGMQPWQMQGTWILRVTDSGGGDTGGVGAATLRIHYREGDSAIYDNGPMSTGATTGSGVAAPAGYHWSELQQDDSNPGVANTNAGFSSATTSGNVFRIADDFTVPSDQAWTLTHAEFPAYQSGYGGTAAPFDFVSLRIWDGPPTAPGSQLLCGDEATNVYLGAHEMGLLRVFNSLVGSASAPGSTRRIWAMRASIPAACAGTGFFAAGTYWLDWNSRIPGMVAHFTPTVTLPGIRSQPGDNAQQRDTTGLWVPLMDVGNPVTPPSVPVALPFKLYGTVLGLDIFADGFE